MRLAIGIALAVAGGILLVLGIQESDSFASDVSKFFTGNPTDRSIWLMIIGVFALLAGIAAAAAPWRFKRI